MAHDFAGRNSVKILNVIEKEVKFRHEASCEISVMLYDC